MVGLRAVDALGQQRACGSPDFLQALNQRDWLATLIHQRRLPGKDDHGELDTENLELENKMCPKLPTLSTNCRRASNRKPSGRCKKI
jgi:hypothetical protein